MKRLLASIAARLAREWLALRDYVSPKLGCCGCGAPIVNVVLVEAEASEKVASETYCWSCWHQHHALRALDHLELPAPLFRVPWRRGLRTINALIAAREETR